ncbi:MAG: ChbG/HpnK family deacetylase [Cytophagales bacterium]|uniref:polysaccharide deacetylase family protein n=1 Tax=Cyclobacterium marinum TaxID=104 RepID=UPI0030D9BD9E|nr:ChbG/HpnK family deacetylase [Cytophagales bacterium]|tara:strand:+ start:4199 stop:5194 length:996 start_codon:yes stop_codon:yes gene_type:complete
MQIKIFSSLFLASLLIISSCGQKSTSTEVQETETKTSANWAERLGYPEGKKVIMLHADDIGMSPEANTAAKEMLMAGDIQSAAAMPPCPNFEEIIAWAIEHPEIDLGLHLALTSEWKTWRWSSVAPAEEVPGLIDDEGMLWRSVEEVVANASAEEVATEVRAQIEKSLALGYRPDHIDTHMGTLYGDPKYAIVYLKMAMEYGIPANAIDLSKPEVVEIFRQGGYPITDEVVDFMATYTLPKLDFFTSAPKADTYEEKKEAFKELIRSLKPGLTEIIFHPSADTEQLKTITGSWQQRIWEAEMFADPDLKQFFEDEGIIFTDWKEIMKRFNS